MSNKAVVDGVIQYVSVSQIQTFDIDTFGGCPRKWWYDKIAGVPQPTTKAQAIGSEVHKQIENYLLTGEDTLGPIARAGKHFLPTPKIHLLVEHEFTPTSLDVSGIPLKGFIDVVNESGRYKDNEGKTYYEDIVEVIDHKTTSDFKYSKSASDLRKSIQMVGYAEFVRRRDVTGVSRVRVSHNNFLTRGAPAARKVTTTIEVPEILSKWESVAQTVNAMKVVAKAQRVEDVDANYEACSAYRGCPYLSICPRAKDALMSFIEAKGDGMSLLNRFMKQTVNPPDAVVDPSKAAEPIPAETLATMSPEIQAAAALFPPPEIQAQVTTVVIPTSNEITTVTTEQNEPKKRGRKPGSKNASRVERGEEKVTVLGDVLETLELYVDCSVTGVYTSPLDGYITGKCRELEQRFGAADLRCAPMDSPLAYNKWKGALAALVRNEPPPVYRYTLDDVRESEIKQVVVEALKPMCGVFVRGR